jgi:transposase-like protein
MKKPACNCCHKSDAVIRKGRYKNKSTGQTYRIWYCKSCRHKFVPESLYKRKRHRRKVINSAVSQRKDGISLSKIVNQIREVFGKIVAPKTILNWARQASQILQKFEVKIRKNLKIRGSVHSDEVYIPLNGEKIPYFCSRDRKTKYTLTAILAMKKFYIYVKEIFRRLKHEFANRPKHLFSDKLGHYKKAFKKYFLRTAKLTFGVPIACKKHGLKYNNNCIERFNEFVREICKVFRNFKNLESAFDQLELHRICLNFLHLLASLKTKKKKKRTPAEAAGVNLNVSTFSDLIKIATKIVYP